MMVKVNGEKIELSEGSTIQDAIKTAQAPYLTGCVLGLVKGKEEVERHVNKYRLKTNQGSIIIELDKNAPQDLVKLWKERYHDFAGLRIRWITSQEVSVGPIVTQLVPSHDEYTYDRWDVIFSLSGFTADATHIIFSKDKHKSVYGVPEGGNGVFARVVGGKRTIMKLTDDDHVLDVKPVVERKSIVKSAAITDLETVLSEGNQVFTYLLVNSEPKSPQSVEHFFALAENGKLRVDYDSNSFMGSYGLQGLKRESEYIDKRRRGTVTLRNQGKGMGRVYIYREDRVSTPSHNVLGKVEKGMQLIDIARYGDEVTVRTQPDRIMTLAMTQKEAQEFLQSQNVKQIREGLKNDDALVVGQEPHFTMEILQNKEVKTFGVSENDLVEIELTDNAPRSTWYFQKITGLLEAPVGSLKVHFAFPGMNLMMFQGDSREAKGLIPENSPQQKAKAWEIGLTNMSRRHIGMLGIRFEDNEEFGPTGEPFQGTNILGKVVKGKENLKKFKEGETVYVRRV
ncbi:MAG TPA: methanogenesis marker 3 protein [Methanobacteriaceae archaeon]|nr:methanogenesis marker 3 protein [Methanobacteriaceae archaeon]